MNEAVRKHIQNISYDLSGLVSYAVVEPELYLSVCVNL